MGASYRFSELTVGDVFDTAGATLSEGTALDFAARFDPHPAYRDAEAPGAAGRGGLAVSPFQILAQTWRLVADLGLFAETLLGVVGMEEVQFLRPVTVGQTLRARAEVLALNPARSRRDRGFAQIRLTGLVSGVPVVVASLTLSLAD